MVRFPRSLSPRAAIGAGTLIWLLVVMSVAAMSAATTNDQSAKPPAAPAVVPAPDTVKPPSTAATPGAYAGSDVCLTCHEDKNKGYKGTPHARAGNPRTPGAGQGCESCHGPGQAHVDAGGDGHIKNPTKLQPHEVSELCTTCHNRSEHNQWDGSKHDSRNMSCATCHSVHEARSDKARLKTDTITETCVQCHRKEVSKVHKASHMPVREGKMECTTCHNPHGSQNVKLLREGNSINEACATCHAEKRGPFLWEHAVGRENCTTCHDPHGSNNERMLVAKLPVLCQKCHIHSRHPATIYDDTQLNTSRSNRVVGRACVNCHQMVHGSNHPTSGKFFIR